MLPLIAVVADALDDAAPPLNQRLAPYAPAPLVAAVVAAGGLPIVLPRPASEAAAAALAKAYLPHIDGLILPGGPDVDPTYYGEEPLAAIGTTDRLRDAFEIPLIRATLAAGKPLLGICRGLQVACVALGGTLYQDLATQDPDYRLRHAQAAPGTDPTHHVTIAPASRLATLIGTTGFVNSRHHQAVRMLPAGLRAVAHAQDGVIEAVESVADDRFLAVQWHPENMWQAHPEQLKLFKDLVVRAEASR
ncbi:gamma-glutamyl-gamma-aminobutyrate hydrolase family protein [Lacticaseibacillus suihuaensis]